MGLFNRKAPSGSIAVSVLTPVYNVEPYLRECLDSLESQTLREMEFICINDGSTDDSLAILKEYARRDSRFVIIDKPNSGYGASMNCGLDVARGEYVGIVESDDKASRSMFRKLYDYASKHDCDIVKSNYYEYDGHKSTKVDVWSPFRTKCVYGITANKEKMHDNLHNSLMLVTALNPYIGYENAAKTSHLAFEENISLKEACVRLGFLTAEKFDEVFHPEEMI